jgi:hypothetical protein
MSLWDRPNGSVSPAANSATASALNVQASLPAPLPASQNFISATEAIIVSPSNPAAALTITISPFTALEQTVFDIIASGLVTTRTSSNITIGLYVGSSITVVAGSLLHKTATPVAINSTTAPWWIHAMLIYDSVSGKLQGKCGGTINNTIDPEIAISNVPTGVSNAANPVATFSLSAISSGATAPNPTTINIQKFNAG